MTALVARVRTARGYMAEFGVTGGLMSAAFVLFLMLGLLTTFTVWPAGALQQGGGAELDTGNSGASPGSSGAATLPDPVGRPIGTVGSLGVGGGQSAPGRDEQGGTDVVGGGGITDGGGGSGTEITGGGEETAPNGGGSNEGSGNEGSGSGSTPGSPGNGLKLGHSKTPNGNGNGNGNGNSGTTGNGAAKGKTKSVEEESSPPGQTKASKKTKD